MTSKKQEKQRDMSHSSSRATSPIVEWSTRYGFKAFGDRLDFLSPERQQLNSGKLRILAPLNPERRNGRAS